MKLCMMLDPRIQRLLYAWSYIVFVIFPGSIEEDNMRKWSHFDRAAHVLVCFYQTDFALKKSTYLMQKSKHSLRNYFLKKLNYVAVELLIHKLRIIHFV